jgi:hypothetical protein
LSADDIDLFSSEVSTMLCLKQNTTVKVPELYAWNIPKVSGLARINGLSLTRRLDSDDIP